MGVVILRIVGQQHPQPVPDGNPRRNHQKPLREPAPRGIAHRIHRLPGNQHRHHRRLARPGGQLQPNAEQIRVGVPVAAHKMIPNAVILPPPPAPPPPAAAPFRQYSGHFRKPDDRFRRLNLAEKRPRPGKIVMPPVLQQLRRFRRYAPVGGVRQLPPGIHPPPDFVDDRRRVKLLLLGGQPGHPQRQRPLPGLPPRRRHRRNILRLPPHLHNAIRRRPVLQLPVPAGILVGRIQNRLRRKSKRHLYPAHLRQLGDLVVWRFGNSAI